MNGSALKPDDTHGESNEAPGPQFPSDARDTPEQVAEFFQELTAHGRH
jgi:hypothetical protein